MFSYFTYEYWFPKIQELNPNEYTKIVLNKKLSERINPKIIEDPFLNELKGRLSQNQFGLKFTGLLEFD